MGHTAETKLGPNSGTADSGGTGYPRPCLSPAHSPGRTPVRRAQRAGREPREEAGESVPVSPGLPQRDAASPLPGRESRPRRGPQRFPPPGRARHPGSRSGGTCPGAARGSSPTREYCREAGGEEGSPRPPRSPLEPPPRVGAAGRLGRALSLATPARTHRARGGDHPPGRRCPASPPLPAAPRRPPPLRRGGALAGAGAAPPAPTPAAAPGAAAAASRGAVPAASGGRAVRGSGGSIPLSSLLPVSNSSHRHLTGGAGTGTGTPIRAGTRIPTGTATRT